ncbi:uncharacterized protein LOC133845265 isoform X3 [Drosophila sulfurigaster albostrigata]|uniref:uncharacterized protein LOC133845265 isoform X3 n=1 Tax=Drosophila sulfurigaster albostrigata TaxID=89887 RepID=UPI002D21BEFB|nr:uncharacterized protein LOC133845265 isoform X3 [Drosophila sulfurigaster albostrigata]
MVSPFSLVISIRLQCPSMKWRFVGRVVCTIWTSLTMLNKINLILVFDESQLGSGVLTEIMRGGIGFNFTTLRLRSFYSDGSKVKSAKVTVLIYGLEESHV